MATDSKNDGKTAEELGAELKRLSSKVLLLADQLEAARQNLDEKKNHFDMLAELATDGFCIVQDKRIIYASTRMAALVEYEVEQLTGIVADELIPETNRDALLEDFRAQLEAEPHVASTETEITTGRGNRVFLEIQGTEIAHDGRVAELIVARNISRRKWTMDALNRERNAFRLVAQASVQAKNTLDYCTRIITGLTDALGYEFGSIRLVDESGEVLLPTVVVGLDDEDREKYFVDMPIADTPLIAAMVSRSRVGIFCPDAPNDPILSKHKTLIRKLAARSIIAWPVVGSNKKLLGVLQLWSCKPYLFEDAERAFFESIVDTFAAGLEKVRAEGVLKESEEKYRFLAEQSLVAMAIIQNQRFVWVNEHGAELTGYTQKQMLEWGPGEFGSVIYPEDREFVIRQSTLKQTDQVEGVIPQYDFRLMTRQGKVRWVNLYSKTISYGGSPAVQLMFVDISKRKIAEQAQAASEERFRTLFNAVAEAIVAVSNDGKISLYNPAAERMFGFDAKEALGKSPSMLLPTRYRESHEKYLENFFTRGATRGMLGSTIDAKGQRKDGTRFPIEISLTDGKVGNERFVLAVVRDITERKQFQDKLFAERQRLHALFEMLPASVSLMSRDLNYRFVNRKFRDNFGDPEGKTCYQQFYGRKTRCEPCRMMQVFDEKKPIEWEWEAKNKRVFQFYIYPFSDTDGTLLALELGVDVTDRVRVQQELEKSETRYRAIIEDQTEMICRFLPDGRVTFVNEAYCRYFNSTVDQIIGVDWKQYLPEKDRIEIERMLASISVENPMCTVEHRVLRRDGTIAWHQWTDRGIFDEQGNVVEFQSVGRDITDKRNAERALAQSEKRYRLLAESVNDVIFTIDRKMNFTYVSPSVGNLMGYSPQEVMSLPPKQMAMPKSLKKLQKLIQDEEKAQATRSDGKKTTSRTVEVEVKNREGQGVWCEANVSFVWAREQEPDWLFGVLRNISERKKAEQLLEAERKVLADIIQLNPYSIQLCDADGRQVAQNKAFEELFEVIPSPDYTIFRDPLLKQGGIQEEFKQIRKGKVIRTKEDLWYDPHDIDPSIPSRKRCIRAVAFPIMNPQGKLERIVCMHRDITKEKQAEQGLKEALRSTRQADMLKAQFIGNMSHELRTPLNSINGLATVMQLNKNLPEEKKEAYLNIIRRSGDSLLAMIDQILELARIHSGKVAPTPEPLNLKDLVKSLGERYEFQAGNKDLEFRLTLDSTIPKEMAGDRVMLEQVLNNLIENAFKFTKKGFISLDVQMGEAKGKEAEIRFAVTDSGIGIPKENQEMIFMTFFQVDGTTTREYGGVGLGLAICKDLVEQMGGTISVESEQGKGTTFTFTVKMQLFEEKRWRETLFD